MSCYFVDGGENKKFYIFMFQITTCFIQNKPTRYNMTAEVTDAMSGKALEQVITLYKYVKY